MGLQAGGYRAGRAGGGGLGQARTSRRQGTGDAKGAQEWLHMHAAAALVLLCFYCNACHPVKSLPCSYPKAAWPALQALTRDPHHHCCPGLQLERHVDAGHQHVHQLRQQAEQHHLHGGRAGVGEGVASGWVSGGGRQRGRAGQCAIPQQAGRGTAAGCRSPACPSLAQIPPASPPPACMTSWMELVPRSRMRITLPAQGHNMVGFSDRLN